MDQETTSKIKKSGGRILAIIGALTILGIIGSIFLAGLNNARQKSSLPSFTTGSISNLIGSSGFTTQFFGAANELMVPSGVSSKNTDVSDGALTQRKIVKNGSLSLLVKKAEEVASDIRALAARLNGFISDSRIYETSAGIKSGSVTLRIPADRFDEALTEIKKLAVKVESENINAQDVTEQFIDLEARLRNFKRQEEQYIEILKRANSVQNVLSVTQQLTSIRGQIEQIEGQLQYLSRQVDMSVITVALIAEADVEVFGIRWRPLYVLKQSLRSMFGGLTSYVDAMIWFVLYLPVIILWLATGAIIVIVGWKVVKWMKQKFFSSEKLP